MVAFPDRLYKIFNLHCKFLLSENSPAKFLIVRLDSIKFFPPLFNRELIG